MKENTEQRKLAAIMFTDMVGYSALSQRDLGWIKVDPLLDQLCGHPRFEAFVKRVVAPKTDAIE